jgi:hypothetical protein
MEGSNNMKYELSLILIALLTVGCGSDVLTGRPGKDGVDGYTSLLSLGAADLCVNGGNVFSSGLDLNRDGSLQLEETQAVAVVCNGRDGTDGNDGVDGSDAVLPSFTPVGILNPCGDNPSLYDEVFLKLANGMVLASFSDKVNGENTRFSILVAGTYVTTDGDHCTFTVDSSGGLTNESHHF